jgi:PAS domain S-box-containing protein
MRKVTWRTKLLASFAIVLGIVFAFELLYVLPKLRDREIELVVTSQEDIARSIARELDVDLSRISDRLVRMAARAEFREMNPSLQLATMTQHIEISSLVETLFVINSEGFVIARTEGDLSPVIFTHLVENPCFTVPFSAGEIHFSEPQYDAALGIVFVNVSAPIELETGTRIGVLAARLVLNELIKQVQDYPLLEGAVARVVSQEGIVVACSCVDTLALEDGPLSYEDEERPLIEAIIAGDVKELGQHDHGAIPYFGTFSILESNGWAVIVGSTVETIQSSSASMFWVLVFSNIALFIGAMAAVFFLSRAIMARQERTEARFRSFYEDSPLGYQSLDSEARLLDVNHKWLEATGYEKDEVIGHALSEFLSPTSAVHHKESFERTKPTGAPHGAELELQRKDGSHFVALFSGTVACDDKGNFKQTHCILTDITERKQAEQMLEQERDRAQTYLDVAAVTMIALDREGCITLANRQGAAMLGYSEQELLGKDWFDTCVPARLRNVVRDVFKELMAGIVNPVEHYENPILTKDGEERIVAWHNAILRDDEGMIIGTLSSGLDITDRKKAEEDKLAIEAHLRQAQKLESIGTLASGVAHEINNPLMGMMNYAELVMDKVQDPKAVEYLEEIGNEGNRVAKIVRNLLSFSRQDNEEHVRARIADIIDDSLSLVGSILKRDQIRIKLDIPENLPQLKCRSQQIQQVFINLLTNAHDALVARYPGYDDNKLVRITVRLFEKEGEDWIRTTIEDHGIGISEDLTRRVFDPFYTTKPRDKGTGLGLSVSFGIVKEHHGELTVESVLGEFTRFHMDLRVNNGWSHRDKQEDAAELEKRSE